MPPNSDDFNTDELEAPQWLNAEFLANVLQSSENDQHIEVRSFKLTPGTAKGDHYASVMFRAAIDYLQQGVLKSKSVIIKTMPEVEGLKKEMLDQSVVFENEIGIYTDVIPKFEEILRAVGDNTVLGARCLYQSLTPKKCIVFEDLVPLGYTVLRDRQANIEEAKGAYLKLAKWHAVSYKLQREQPSLFDKYQNCFMAIPAMEKNDFVTGGITLFIEMLDSVPSLLIYKPYFEALAPTLFQKTRDSYLEYSKNPQEDSHYVFCHGDFHCKNMMFKNNPESGKFEDAILLDFQITYTGAIVNDFIYSMFMILDGDLRINHLDEMFYFYFTNFLETLQKIGYEGRLPKLTELREQLIRRSHFQIYLLVTFLPMWYGFAEGKNDADQMMNSAEYRRHLYHNKEYIEQLHLILPKWLHLGYFENY